MITALTTLLAIGWWTLLIVVAVSLALLSITLIVYLTESLRDRGGSLDRQERAVASVLYPPARRVEAAPVLAPVVPLHAHKNSAQTARNGLGA